MLVTDILFKNLYPSHRKKHGGFLKTQVSKSENLFAASRQSIDKAKNSRTMLSLLFKLYSKKIVITRDLVKMQTPRSHN